jgi:glycine hydroxymethyltransferase
MGLSLPHGGHLTHGWSVSITGKWFQPVPYYVNPSTGRVDLDEVRTIALKERPKLIFCGGTAIPRQIDFPGFAAVAKEAGALLVADIAHIAGLVAGGAHPSPVGHVDVVSTTTHKTLRGPRGAMLLASPDYADKIDRAVFPGLQGGPHMHTIGAIAVALHEAAQPSFKRYAQQIVKNASVLADSLLERGFNLVSGGTDNHLILVDLQNRQVGGKAVAHALDEAGLVCNYNTVPNDPRKPRDPSGIRLGTAAATTRGMTETEMRLIAGWIGTVVNAVAAGNEGPIATVKQEVASLAREFPVP